MVLAEGAVSLLSAVEAPSVLSLEDAASATSVVSAFGVETAEGAVLSAAVR
jgi:hypothetical protein